MFCAGALRRLWVVMLASLIVYLPSSSTVPLNAPTAPDTLEGEALVALGREAPVALEREALNSAPSALRGKYVETPTPASLLSKSSESKRKPEMLEQFLSILKARLRKNQEEQGPSSTHHGKNTLEMVKRLLGQIAASSKKNESITNPPPNIVSHMPRFLPPTQAVRQNRASSDNTLGSSDAPNEANSREMTENGEENQDDIKSSDENTDATNSDGMPGDDKGNVNRGEKVMPNEANFPQISPTEQNTESGIAYSASALEPNGSAYAEGSGDPSTAASPKEQIDLESYGADMDNILSSASTAMPTKLPSEGVNGPGKDITTTAGQTEASESTSKDSEGSKTIHPHLQPDLMEVVYAHPPGTSSDEEPITQSPFGLFGDKKAVSTTEAEEPLTEETLDVVDNYHGALNTPAPKPTPTPHTNAGNEPLGTISSEDLMTLYDYNEDYWHGHPADDDESGGNDSLKDFYDSMERDKVEKVKRNTSSADPDVEKKEKVSDINHQALPTVNSHEKQTVSTIYVDITSDEDHLASTVSSSATTPLETTFPGDISMIISSIPDTSTEDATTTLARLPNLAMPSEKDDPSDGSDGSGEGVVDDNEEKKIVTDFTSSTKLPEATTDPEGHDAIPEEFAAFEGSTASLSPENDSKHTSSTPASEQGFVTTADTSTSLLENNPGSKENENETAVEEIVTQTTSPPIRSSMPHDSQNTSASNDTRMLTLSDIDDLQPSLRNHVIDKLGGKFFAMAMSLHKPNMSDPYPGISDVVTKALSSFRVDFLSPLTKRSVKHGKNSSSQHLYFFVNGIKIDQHVPRRPSLIQKGKTRVTHIEINKKTMDVNLRLRFDNISVLVNTTVRADLFPPFFSVRKTEKSAEVTIDCIEFYLRVPYQLIFRRRRGEDGKESAVGVLVPDDFIVHGSCMRGVHTRILGCRDKDFMEDRVLRFEEHLKNSLETWVVEDLPALAKTLRQTLQKRAKQTASVTLQHIISD